MSAAPDLRLVRSRWATLVDARAAALLASACDGGSALVVDAPGGYAPPVAVGAAAEGAADVVLDPARPETPRDVAALAARCRPGGAVALVAGGVRDVATVGTALARYGCVVERVVPFDALGPGSAWRRAVGVRAAEVLAELERWLGHPGVRALARLVEREVVAHVPWTTTSRALVVARRGDARVAPVAAALPARLYAPDVAAHALALLQDDAVVRATAFLEAEILAPLGVAFDLTAYLLAVAAHGARAARRAACAGRRWFAGYDARRLVEARSVRLVERAVARLATRVPDDLAATFTYPLLETCHAALDPGLPDPWTARSSS